MKRVIFIVMRGTHLREKARKRRKKPGERLKERRVEVVVPATVNEEVEAINGD